MLNRSLWLAAVAVGLFASQAQAVVQGTQFDSTTGFSGVGEFAPLNNDLLQGLIETGSVFADQEGLNADTTAASLTNGLFGPAGLTPPPGPNPEVSIIGGGQTLTYTLPPVAGGYTVSEFRIYSGWQDTGRSRQDFTLLFATEAAPAVFTPLITYSGTANTLDELTIVKDSLGATIPGVVAIQFQTAGNVQNGYVGYREFDLVGAPTVPEPASLSILGLGAAATLIRRRRA